VAATATATIANGTSDPGAVRSHSTNVNPTPNLTRRKGVNMAGKRGRSAITGRFVKQSTVKRSPKTTINQSTKKSKLTCHSSR
jgi:hypothetical protein